MALPVSLSIAVLGFLPLLIVIWKGRRIKKLKETGVLVTGVVEDVIERRGYKGSRYYQGIFQYYVPGRGTMRSSYIFNYGKKPIYTRRQSVELYYRKDKPEKFIPKDKKIGKTALIFTIVIAAAYIILSFFLYGFIKNSGG